MKDNPNLRSAIYGGAFVALLVLVGWGRIAKEDVPYWVTILNAIVAGAPLVALSNVTPKKEVTPGVDGSVDGPVDGGAAASAEAAEAEAEPEVIHVDLSAVDGSVGGPVDGGA